MFVSSMQIVLGSRMKKSCFEKGPWGLFLCSIAPHLWSLDAAGLDAILRSQHSGSRGRVDLISHEAQCKGIPGSVPMPFFHDTDDVKTEAYVMNTSVVVEKQSI